MSHRTNWRLFLTGHDECTTVTMSAIPAPPAEEIQALSTLRNNLSTLALSLRKLSADISNTGPATPLPPYKDLLSALNYASFHIQQLAAHTSRHKSFFDAAHAYPLPNFPVPHEALLSQLVRKNESEEVAEWIAGASAAVDKARAELRGKDGDAKMADASGEKGTGLLGADDLKALWAFAGTKAAEEVNRVPKGLDYTIEEAVNGIDEVETGLKKKLNAGPFGDEEEESGSDFESGEEDEDEMDVDEKEQEKQKEKAKEREISLKKELSKPPALPPMPLDDVLRFMTTGSLPRRGGIGMIG